MDEAIIDRRAFFLPNVCTAFDASTILLIRRVGSRLLSAVQARKKKIKLSIALG